MGRIMTWSLGLVVGLFAGGSMLSFGTFALIVGLPAIIWVAIERRRPTGLAGLLVGAGLAIGGLPALAAARCSAFGRSVEGVSESCTSPDVTPFLVAGIALAIAGTVLTVVMVRRGGVAPTA